MTVADNCTVGIEPGDRFPAYVDEQRWNGFVVPRFTRPTVEEVARVLNARNLVQAIRQGDTEGIDAVTFDGDTLILDEGSYARDDDYAPLTLRPGPDGRYALGAWRWTWMVTGELEQD